MSNTSRRNHIKQGRMLIVADLYKRGWSIRKIAAEVSSRMNTTCSTRTIWRDIQDLLDEWRSLRINDVDQRLQLELERIDDAVCELWEQWDKSKENWVREYNKRVGVPVPVTDGNGQPSETSPRYRPSSERTPQRTWWGLETHDTLRRYVSSSRRGASSSGYMPLPRPRSRARTARR